MKPKSGPILSFDKKYMFQEKKGEGGFGKAYVIMDRETHEEFIAKCNINPENDEKVALFEQEIEILKKLKDMNNPYIIRIKESGYTNIDQLNQEGDTKYMILEYAKKRELFDYIVYAGQKGFGETFGKIIFSKILNGMRTIHELGYCHKDLSLSNIFLDENYDPKIGDFGAAMENRDDLTGTIGTDKFRAPEINKSLPHNGQKADIFSLGQILIYIVFGKSGFNKADSDDPMYRLIINGNFAQYWDNYQLCLNKENIQISDQFKDLYQRMVCNEPNNRLTVNEILDNHPWIQPFNNIENINKIPQEELKNLRNEFRVREYKIKAEIIKEIKESGNDGHIPLEIKPNTRKISHGDKFNSDKEPKNFPDYYNERFNIIFKEYSKNNANKIMNNLYAKIFKKYGNNCGIECSPDKFKMFITFEDEQGEPIEMKIKLYQFKDGLILKFFRKSKDKTEFFEKFKEIVELLTENK